MFEIQNLNFLYFILEEIKELSTAEPDNTDKSEGAGCDETEASSSNKTATKTEEPGKCIRKSHNKFIRYLITLKLRENF